MAPDSPGHAGKQPLISIEVVWLRADWPDGSPLPASVDQLDNAYALEGQEARQPQLGSARLQTRAGITLGELLTLPELTAVAAAAEAGTIGLALHGRRGRLTQPLAEGDRLELLGPITADPKSARLARVQRDRAAAGRDKWRTA